MPGQVRVAERWAVDSKLCKRRADGLAEGEWPVANRT